MIQTKHLTIHKYRLNTLVNKSKKLLFPSIRGTLLPSFDPQYIAVDRVKISPTTTTFSRKLNGIAINWLWIRIKIIARDFRI